MTLISPIQRILLIDDDDDDCFIFREVVKEINSDVILKYVYESEESMPVIEKFQPDIIFLDINLPAISGHTLLQELKNSTYTHIPVVMYSTSVYPKDIDLSYRLGSTLYFCKTGSLDELKVSLKQILSMEWHKPDVISTQYFRDGKYYPYSIKSDLT